MSPISVDSDGHRGSRPVALVDGRANVRYRWCGTVSLRVLPQGDEVLGVLLDLSTGGCGVELGVAPNAEVGTRVEVEMFANGMTLKRTEIIRNINSLRCKEKETRAGIQFIDSWQLKTRPFRSGMKARLRARK